jgi:hypothetical protein
MKSELVRGAESILITTKMLSPFDNQRIFSVYSLLRISNEPCVKFFGKNNSMFIILRSSVKALL